MSSESDSGGDRSPAAVFELLANDTRMAALESLWQAGQPLSFSEMADHAGARYTGNFSYHLERLQPDFVRQVDEGYALTRAGQRVLTAVLARRFSDHAGFDRVTVDYACPFCDSAIVLEHGDDALHVACTECPGVYRGRSGSERLTKVWLPPAGVREAPTATLDAALQWTFTRNWAFARGVCPECAGAVDTEPVVCPDHDAGPDLCPTCDGRYGVLARYRCRTCHEQVTILALFTMLTDPQVRAFFYEHDLDPTAFTYESMMAVFPYEETVLDRNPIRFELRVDLEGETLVVTGDETGAPVAIERRA